MHPAIEIDLHVDGICAAQRQTPIALGAAFRALDVRSNLLPLRRHLGEEGRPRCSDRRGG
jgi:hypothetical protein